jgi:inner membrane protein
VSRAILPRFTAARIKNRYFVTAGMFGAIAPDIDMIYFYVVANREKHHHLYFPHFPVVWFCLLIVTYGWVTISERKTYASIAFIFSLNGLVHMILDSVAGDIWWFAPWSNVPFSMFTVSARYETWWLNFLLHWTFLIEILVFVVAAVLFQRSFKR